MTRASEQDPKNLLLALPDITDNTYGLQYGDAGSWPTILLLPTSWISWVTHSSSFTKPTASEPGDNIRTLDTKYKVICRQRWASRPYQNWVLDSVWSEQHYSDVSEEVSTKHNKETHWHLGILVTQEFGCDLSDDKQPWCEVYTQKSSLN